VARFLFSGHVCTAVLEDCQCITPAHPTQHWGGERWHVWRLSDGVLSNANYSVWGCFSKMSLTAQTSTMPGTRTRNHQQCGEGQKQTSLWMFLL